MPVDPPRLDCGHRLSANELVARLCPKCLLHLGLTSVATDSDPGSDSALPTLASPSRFDSESPTALYDEHRGGGRETFTRGQLLGQRYRIESLLGRGGMGEVWRAYDLKLRLEVALKSLHPRLFESEDGLELLRDEVRAAREVVSPNVCRLFDLVEVEGRELVSMEYIDGVTLLEHLKEQGPLELKEANEIASQLLAGLEAVHEAGLVHRDVKPENTMLTRAGRVVVMDFGLTSPSGSGTVGGTPAYMPPEQARGEATDARADVFSAGMVLAEMLSAERGPDESSRQTFWEEIRKEPPVLPESPWKQILSQAVSPDADERYTTAADLARALEEVAFRAEGIEHEHPYPGLESFQREDAELFFGREAEVEAVWKRLQQVNLLGLMGPSGSGKSSFINAGLLPAAPEGWSCLRMSPSADPFTSLGRELLPGIETDQEAMDLVSSLKGLDPVLEVLREQRAKHGEFLIVVDQFEELFTQSSEDIQERFAELLGRAALEADVHVLLSMRDDYLFQCQTFEILRPLFSELTPLGPPTGSSLRRAIVQPALRCGFRFEDDSIVEEMLQQVTKERAALPLIAFTAAQLWERRDQETGYLTRSAYESIGGVGGALAQHAEATLQRIGQGGWPIVRELFRNLVTADGTRASRDREELLSVFDADQTAGRGADRFNVEDRLKRPAPVPADRPGPKPQDPSRRSTAATVLDALIDSRLLTSFEIPEREGRPGHQRVEIIHESLLSAWPRLARWQMQDAEGAKLRDELRAQAQVWEQHGRTDDYLWTGAAYLDFLAWRARYPGGLTALEGAYGEAVIRFAERRKRRRRMAASAVVLLALLVAMVTGGLWLRSEAEARRAEASKLLALAQLRIEADPTEALAFTTASLELADTEEARIFAVKTLRAGPPVRVLDPGTAGFVVVPVFSPDGRWLSGAGNNREEVPVWHQDGSGPVILGGHVVPPSIPIQTAWISENRLITGHWTEGRARIWSFPAGKLVREIDLGGPAWWQAGETHLFAQVVETDAETGDEVFHLRSWRLSDGDPEELGAVDSTTLGASSSFFAPDGSGWLYTKGSEVFYRPLPVRERIRDWIVGWHANEARLVGMSEHSERALRKLDESDRTDRLWTRDATNGELRLWSLSAPAAEPLQVVTRPAGVEEDIWFQPPFDGRWLLDYENSRDGKALLWDPLSLPGANPRELKRSGSWYYSQLDLHPSGDWIVASTAGLRQLSFWPLRELLPMVVTGYGTEIRRPVVFTPDGKWLASYWGQNKVRLWPLPGSGSREIGELEIAASNKAHTGLAIDPAGEQILVTGYGDGLFVVPLEGGEARRLGGFPATTVLERGAFSPSGRLAAAATGWASEELTLRVWDLQTEETKEFALPQLNDDRGTSSVGFLAFADESRLFTAGGTGVLRWDLEAGTFERIVSIEPGHFAGLWLSGDRQQLITVVRGPAGDCGPLVLHDLPTGQSRELRTFITCPDLHWEVQLAFDDTLSVMAIGRADGTLWVGRVGGGAPQLLTGHQGPITGLALSQDGRWIASSGQDMTLRLWPMPDLDKPPLHTLPLEELLAKLGSLTNLRAVQDSETSTGWSIEIGPFPGWEEVPTW